MICTALRLARRDHTILSLDIELFLDVLSHIEVTNEIRYFLKTSISDDPIPDSPKNGTTNTMNNDETATMNDSKDYYLAQTDDFIRNAPYGQLYYIEPSNT